MVVITVVGLIILGVVAGKNDKVEYTTIKVERGAIIQTVSETGTVKAANEIDLSFLNSGRLSRSHYKIGSKVAKGVLIAELDYQNLSIKKDEVKASLDIAKEDLNKLLSGATTEEIGVARASVEQAKASYEAAKKNLEQTKKTVNEDINQAARALSDLESATPATITATEQAVITAETNLVNTGYTYQQVINNSKESAIITVEDKLAVVKNSLDIIDRILTDDDAKDLISVKNLTYLEKTKIAQKTANDLLAIAVVSLEVAKNGTDNGQAQDMVVDALEVMDMTFDCLELTYSALEESITSSTFTLTELNAFKTDIATQQAAIALAISLLQTKQQSLDDAILDYGIKVDVAQDSLTQAKATYTDAVTAASNKLATSNVLGEKNIIVAESSAETAMEAWLVTQAQFNKTTAVANKHDVTLYKAKIRQAQAAYDSVINQIDNSLIKAPIEGTVTNVEYEVGEQVTAGQSVISVLGENYYEIEVLISEADIAKIEKSDLCVITLDAFGEDLKFNGKVNFIEPAETVIQDVIYYKVIVFFVDFEKDETETPRIKSGMTANIIITTAKKDNILIISSRAVIQKNGQSKIVRVLEAGQLLEKKVSIGLRGDDGLVEILSGLKENEVVVTSIKDK